MTWESKHNSEVKDGKKFFFSSNIIIYFLRIRSNASFFQYYLINLKKKCFSFPFYFTSSIIYNNIFPIHFLRIKFQGMRYSSNNNNIILFFNLIIYIIFSNTLIYFSFATSQSSYNLKRFHMITFNNFFWPKGWSLKK